MNIDQTLLHEQYDYLCSIQETLKSEHIEGILNILEELMD